MPIEAPAYKSNQVDVNPSHLYQVANCRMVTKNSETMTDTEVLKECIARAKEAQRAKVMEKFNRQAGQIPSQFSGTVTGGVVLNPDLPGTSTIALKTESNTIQSAPLRTIDTQDIAVGSKRTDLEIAAQVAMPGDKTLFGSNNITPEQVARLTGTDALSARQVVKDTGGIVVGGNIKSTASGQTTSPSIRSRLNQFIAGLKERITTTKVTKEIYQKNDAIRAAVIAVPETTNPLFPEASTGRVDTTGVLAIAAGLLPGAIPFSEQDETLVSQAQATTEATIKGATPTPLGGTPIAVNSTTVAQNILRGLAPENTTFGNTNTTYNFKSGATSGFGYGIGLQSHSTMSTNITSNGTSVGEKTYLLKKDLKTNSNSKSIVNNNGIITTFDGVIPIRFIVGFEEYNQTAHFQRNTVTNTTMIPVASVSGVALGKLDANNNPNTFIAAKLGINYNQELGIFAKVEAGFRPTINSLISTIVNYNTIPNVRNPNRIEVQAVTKIGTNTIIGASSLINLNNGNQSPFIQPSHSKVFIETKLSKTLSANASVSTIGATAGASLQLNPTSNLSASIFTNGASNQAQLNYNLRVGTPDKQTQIRPNSLNLQFSYTKDQAQKEDFRGSFGFRAQL